MVIGHEPIPAIVNQVGSLAPNRFRDQMTRAPGDVQHGGMKLHHFHVTNGGPSPERDRMTIGSRDVRVRRFAVQPSRPARTQDRLLGPDEGLAMSRVPDQRPLALILMGQEIDRERLLPHLAGRMLSQPVDEGPHDLFAGRIAQSMRHARVAVAPFRCEGQLTILLIKVSPQPHQLANQIRGRVHHRFHNVPIAQPRPSCHGVFDMVTHRVGGIEDPRNAPLRPGTVGQFQAVFGDHDDLQSRIDFQGSPYASDP